MTIDRPIIILGTPRSGTTILFRCLSLHPLLWHVPNESHPILEGPFRPAARNYDSNRVTADDLNAQLVEQLRTEFFRKSINLNVALANPSRILGGSSFRDRLITKVSVTGIGYPTRFRRPASVRFVEKTPKNMLRVPMLNHLFPDALFISLKRNAASNIDSLVAGWFAVDQIGPIRRPQSAGAAYAIADQLHLQDYHDKWWKFALVPGWRDLYGKTIADVAAWQYYQCNTYAMEDLAQIEASRVFSLRHEDFVQQPVNVIRQIFTWADLPSSSLVEQFARNLPRVSDATPHLPTSRRGLRHADVVNPAMERLPELKALQQAMGYEV